ncbi:hypothetical protein U9M48_027185, partial [Paspalum notatum var. saurae]
SKTVVAKCNSSGPLYPFHSSATASSPSAFLADASLWHRRLGHPGHESLSRLESESVIPRYNKLSSFGATIKAVQCDNGREFDNSTSRTFFLNRGVHLRMSCPYTSPQNGKAERMIRSINNIIRSLLFQASLPPCYWVEGLHNATYLRNLLPSKTLNLTTTHFALFDSHPSYEHLRVYLSATAPHKLAPRYRCLDLQSRKIIISCHVIFDETAFPFGLHEQPSPLEDLAFLDYSTYPVPAPIGLPPSFSAGTGSVPPTLLAPVVPPGFSLPAPGAPAPALASPAPRAALAATPGATTVAHTTPAAFPTAMDVTLAPHAATDVTSAPHAATDVTPAPRAATDVTPAPRAATDVPVPQVALPVPDRTIPNVYVRRAVHGPIRSRARHSPVHVPVHAPGPVGPPLPKGAVPIAPVVNQHQMSTRGKLGFRQPALFHATSLSPVPRTYRAALADPHWRAAMEKEHAALLQNNTWDLVPRPASANIVSGKWVFKHKFQADGTLERYKARWVLRGFTQRPGIDYDETFSPVVKPATIRTVLSLALSRGWSIHQLDVKNAFLHGTLSETVYSEQPSGFVCRLNRSLYGLKQAPRAWYSRFASHLLSLGFHETKSDTSLFVFHHGSDTVYLLLYVDYIVLTASSEGLLRRIIGALQQEFSMKDLGELHHFLGMQVQRCHGSLLLSQQQYMDILERAGMADCKPCSTPVDTSPKQSADGSAPVQDPTGFRSLAGALQYLTFTRPDISYAMQQICLHMHDPREHHLAALKRILRYIRGTLPLGFFLRPSTVSDLVVYSDADWGGCPDTRKSTSGYAVFLGDNLVSWSSKRQNVISRSSAEAEYRAVANAVAEATWIRQLLLELHTPLQHATLVYCDNISAVYMSSNPVQHQRTKHIEIDLHFVREKVSFGEVHVLHVPTSSQYADIFTKGLPSSVFSAFRSSLNVRGAEAPTAGAC